MIIEAENKETYSVSEKTWEKFSQDYPERAMKMRIIPESKAQYNYDKLVQETTPSENETRLKIDTTYDKILEKYQETVQDNPEDEVNIIKYQYALEVIKCLSNELIKYNPQHEI